MGWFDKKSWRLRRKIKDLQADLREAEKEGKFVVEQGLFFAELEDMGEMTMMVFGTVDTLASQEESVIQTFFERNGFTVARLKLDRTHTQVAEVEIIAPEEFTRVVGRGLKGDGFKMLDDSETERRANIEQKIFPLSALVRSITVLFAERIQEVISTTSIKMNKEGNRLLHWMPKIVQNLRMKLPDEAIEAARPHFETAYQQFYARLGKGGEVSPSRQVKPPAPDETREAIPAIAFPSKSDVTAPTARGGKTAAVTAPAPAVTAPASATSELATLMRDRDAALTTAAMYKSLVKSSASRCVSNAETLLLEVNKFFDAAATCMMVKVPKGHGLTIHAQAGKKLEWGEGAEGTGFAVSASVLSNCISRRQVVLNNDNGADPTQSMLMHQINATAAAPVAVNDEIVGILYVDRRGGFRPFTEQDSKYLETMAKVFQEFPDLTLGIAEI